MPHFKDYISTFVNFIKIKLLNCGRKKTRNYRVAMYENDGGWWGVTSHSIMKVGQLFKHNTIQLNYV